MMSLILVVLITNININQMMLIKLILEYHITITGLILYLSLLFYKFCSGNQILCYVITGAYTE